MKKGFVILTAFAIAAASFGALSLRGENNAEASLPAVAAKAGRGVVKEYDLRDFSRLNVQGVFCVNLTKSPEYKVKLTVPEEYADQVFARVRKGELEIGVDGTVNNAWKLTKRNAFKAEISMPELVSLELGGAVTFTCGDAFGLGDREFTLNQSGASQLKALSVNAKKLDMTVGGASECEMTGSFDRAEIELSGASVGIFKMDAGMLKIDTGGSSNTKINGKFGDVSLEVSGAGECALSGSAENIAVSASGSSNVQAGNLPARRATVNASGAVTCRVNVSEGLTVEKASGSSSIEFQGPESVTVNVKSRTGAATIVRIDE